LLVPGAARKGELEMIINGQTVETMAKQVSTTIAGKEVTLNMAYISETEQKDALTFEFNPLKDKDGYTAKATKAGNKVAIELIKKATKKGEKDTTVFTNLTAQSLFTVLEAAFGQSRATSNSIYVRSNPARKQASRAASSIKVEVEAGVL